MIHARAEVARNTNSAAEENKYDCLDSYIIL